MFQKLNCAVLHYRLHSQRRSYRTSHTTTDTSGQFGVQYPVQEYIDIQTGIQAVTQTPDLPLEDDSLCAWNNSCLHRIKRCLETFVVFLGLLMNFLKMYVCIYVFIYWCVFVIILRPLKPSSNLWT